MSYDTLIAIAKTNQDIKHAEETAELTECPRCQNDDLKKNERGQYSCPWCGWTRL